MAPQGRRTVRLATMAVTVAAAAAALTTAATAAASTAMARTGTGIGGVEHAAATAPPPRVIGFWVVNITSGAWLSRLTDGDTVDEALSPYGIVAATTAGGTRPVVFSAPARYAHTEAERPYSLGWGRRGGNGGGVGRVHLGPGTHTVAAAVGGGGGGAPPVGPTTSVTFSVVWPSVTGFWVVAAPSGRRLFPLVNGTTVDVAVIGRYSNVGRWGGDACALHGAEWAVGAGATRAAATVCAGRQLPRDGVFRVTGGRTPNGDGGGRGLAGQHGAAAVGLVLGDRRGERLSSHTVAALVLVSRAAAPWRHWSPAGRGGDGGRCFLLAPALTCSPPFARLYLSPGYNKQVRSARY